MMKSHHIIEAITNEICAEVRRRNLPVNFDISNINCAKISIRRLYEIYINSITKSFLKIDVYVDRTECSILHPYDRPAFNVGECSRFKFSHRIYYTSDNIINKVIENINIWSKQCDALSEYYAAKRDNKLGNQIKRVIYDRT